MKLAVGLLLLFFAWTGKGTAEPVPVRMDVNHPNIGFAVPIMGGLSEVHGKFSRFEMDLRYDHKDISKSTVAVKIDAASIDTGIDERDQHLRTADFFDTEKFPEITFKSTEVVNREGRLVLHGTLTMHGISKPVSMLFRITGRVTDEKKGTFLMGFKGSITLNRRDFGIDYSHQSVPDFIGDEVRIEIDLITRSNPLPETKAQESNQDG